MAIRTPLLQMLANVYGHIGYQLNPIELLYLPSLLRFFFNLAIDIYLIWFILKRDAFSIGLLISLVQSSKPFFSLMLRIFIQYGNITLNVLHMVYFGLYGRRIFLLLDSPCFYGVFHSRSEAKRIFFWGVVLNSIFFILFNAGNFIQLYKGKFTLQKVVIFFSRYILATMNNFGVYLRMYQQLATKRVLAKVEASLDSKQCDLAQLIASLQSVASVNRSLNQLLSLSFLTFIMISVESLIVTGCYFSFIFSFNNLSSLLYFLHPLECWTVLTLLSVVNRRVVRQFERICRQLADRHRWQQQVILKGTSVMQLNYAHLQTQHQAVLLWASKKFTGCTKNSSSHYNDHLRLHELLMFKPYFEMRLFDMATVNMSFTLAAALFALQNVTFLIQTN